MDTNETLKYILKNVAGISRVNAKENMGNSPKPFQDKYATEQQNLRDEQITKLLTEYVRNYSGKTNSNRKYKKMIFGVTMGLVIGFSFLMLLLFGSAIIMAWTSDSDAEKVAYVADVEQESEVETDVEEIEATTEAQDSASDEEEKSEVSVEMMVSLITVCVSYLTLIFGILTIITKYVFPEKEEEYITAIVKLIQKNDLANKRENMRTDGYEILEKESEKDEE